MSIVVIGGSIIDTTFRATTAKASELAGTSAPMRLLQQSNGGVGRNIAEAMARLGAKPIEFFSVVGNDDQAQPLVQELVSLGISTRFVRTTKEAKTAQYVAVLGADGELAVGVAAVETCDRFLTPTMLWENDAAALTALAAANIVVAEGNLPPSTTLQLLLQLRRSASAGGSQPLVALDPISRSKAQSMTPILTATSGPIETSRYPFAMLLKPNLNEVVMVAKEMRRSILTQPFSMETRARSLSENPSDLLSKTEADCIDSNDTFVGDAKPLAECLEWAIPACKVLLHDAYSNASLAIVLCSMGPNGAFVAVNLTRLLSSTLFVKQSVSRPWSDLPTKDVGGWKPLSKALPGCYGIHVPAYTHRTEPTKVLKVTGAGDTFLSGTLSALHAGKSDASSSSSLIEQLLGRVHHAVLFGTAASWLALRTEDTISRELTPSRLTDLLKNRKALVGSKL